MAIEDIGLQHEYSIDIRLEDDEGSRSTRCCIDVQAGAESNAMFMEGGGLEDALVTTCPKA